MSRVGLEMSPKELEGGVGEGGIASRAAQRPVLEKCSGKGER